MPFCEPRVLSGFIDYIFHIISHGYSSIADSALVYGSAPAEPREDVLLT